MSTPRNPFAAAPAKTTATPEKPSPTPPPAPRSPEPEPQPKPASAARENGQNETASVRTGARNGPRVAVHLGAFEAILKDLHRSEMQRYLNGELRKPPSESDVALRLMKLGKRWLEENDATALPDVV